MAFTTISTNVKYFKYPECKKGQVLIDGGIYKGPTEGKYGTLHNFILPDGTKAVLNKAGQLDWLLENHCQVGTKCRVTFDGTHNLTKGPMAGKDANQFILAVDNEPFTAPLSGNAALPVTATDTTDISL